MICPAFERTSAYLDGELDAAESAAAERHIEACPDCQSLVAAAGRASEALRAPSAKLRAPAHLRAELSRRLAAEATPAPAARRPRDRFWLGSAFGAGATAIAAGLALLVAPLLTAETWVAQLTDAHVRALADGRTIQVASSDHHTVKPWFAGRTPLSPPVHDFAAQGFPLAGGRVDRIGGRAVAVVVYRHGGHEIDLFAWPAQEAAPPASVDRLGYHLRGWRSDDLAFAAVSDTSPDELGRFVDLVQAARE